MTTRQRIFAAMIRCCKAVLRELLADPEIHSLMKAAVAEITKKAETPKVPPREIRSEHLPLRAEYR